MSSGDLNRRDFHRLSMAAMGGLVAGTAIGCHEEKKATQPDPAKTAPKSEATTDAGKPDGTKTEGTAVADAKAEKHLCRGLNSCKGQGGGASAGKNECAGQGECATVAEHTCGGMNDCKNLGGCGDTAGANECKTKGGCHVPLMDSAWKLVRTRFEAKMKADGKKFGPAPAKKSA